MSDTNKDPVATLLYRISILFLFLIGTQAWFTWQLPKTLVYGIIAFVSLLYMRANQIRIPLKVPLGFLFLFITWEYVNWSWRSFALIMFILQFFPLIVFYYDKDSNETLNFVVKWFAILLVPSIILYGLYSVGLLTSGSIITNGASDAYRFQNFYFLITNNLYTSHGRFNAFCLEPGYLGTACAFLLYLYKYNFKYWPNIIIAISLILSFSLAGIILSILGFFFINIRSKKYIKYFLAGFLVLAVSVSFFQHYKGGDNVVNEKILSRLELDDKKGIKGNNRVSYTADYYYALLLAKPDKMLFGYGQKFINFVNNNSTGKGDFGEQIRGAGFIIFVLYNGFVGLVLAILIYLTFALNSCKGNRIYSLCFFILIVLTGIQACYPFSYSWLIPYIGGTRFVFREKRNRISPLLKNVYV